MNIYRAKCHISYVSFGHCYRQDNHTLLIAAETESVALGLALDAFPESLVSHWTVTELSTLDGAKVLHTSSSISEA